MSSLHIHDGQSPMSNLENMFGLLQHGLISCLLSNYGGRQKERILTIELKPEDGAEICQPSTLTPLSKTTSHGW